MRLILTVVAPILAWIALIAWVFASPVASSPDDDFHLAAIWCAGGDSPGRCEPTENSPTARFIPTKIVKATCYAFKPDQDASCWHSDRAGMSRVERANIDGLYPSLYYRFMNIFVSDDVQISVLLMRVANATLITAMLTAVCLTLPRALRGSLIISVIATSVPLGAFLFGSTNPSAWAILSSAMVWICVYGSAVTQGRRSMILGAFAVLGTVIGAGARADAAVFAVFGALLAAILAWRSTNAYGRRVLAVVVAAVVAVSVLLYSTARQGASALSGLEPSDAPLTAAQHLSNLFEVPSLWTGALGQAGLGWLDTRLPASVWVMTTAVFAGALFIGLGTASVRRVMSVALGLCAMWIVPLVMLAQSNAVIGQTVQPRYLLPLMVITVGVASLRVDIEGAWSTTRYALAGSSLAIAMTIALHQNIRRYTAGASDEAIDPGAGAQWWWVGVPSPMIIWLTGSLAFIAFIVILGLMKTSQANRARDSSLPTRQ